MQGIADSADFGFNPRVNAELTSTQIDRNRLGIFTNPDVEINGLDDQARLKLGQQRYIAAVLGLMVGPTEINPGSYTAGAEVTLPTPDLLPNLPERTPAGKFVRVDGAEISQIQADAIYAAHFIANNSQVFSEPDIFEDLFGKVVEQAEEGNLTVEDKVGDPKGAMSLVRQVATVMGYQVQPFARTAQGTFTAQVEGIRTGFDSRFTHFKR